MELDKIRRKMQQNNNSNNYYLDGRKRRICGKTAHESGDRLKNAKCCVESDRLEQKKYISSTANTHIQLQQQQQPNFVFFLRGFVASFLSPPYIIRRLFFSFPASTSSALFVVSFCLLFSYMVTVLVISTVYCFHMHSIASSCWCASAEAIKHLVDFSQVHTVSSRC